MAKDAFETLENAYTSDVSHVATAVTRSQISNRPKTVNVIDSDGEIVETIDFKPRSAFTEHQWQALIPMHRAALLRGMQEYSSRVDRLIAKSNGYKCSVCNDVKWFIASETAPRKVVPCTDCPEYADMRSRDFGFKLEVSGLPTGRNVKRLDEVNFDYQAGNGRKAFDRAYHLSNTIVERNTPTLLVLVGSTGVGKSFLAEGIALEMVRQNRAVFYVTGGLFADMMRPRFGADRNDTERPGRQQFKSGLLKIDNLVFDEVGVGDDPFGSVADEYQDLFSRRYDKGLTTVIAGNIGAVYEEIPERQIRLKPNNSGTESVEKLSAEEHLALVVGDRLVSRLKTGDGSAALASLWECRDVRPFEKKVK